MFQINHIAMMYVISPSKNTFFSSSTHFSQNPFELVHCDLWVPPLLVLLKVSNIFLTLVDDYSRCTCFICLKFFLKNNNNNNLIHKS